MPLPPGKRRRARRSAALLGPGNHDSFDPARGVPSGAAPDRGTDWLNPPTVDLPVPDFSTLSRRAQSLELPAQPRATGGAIHLLVDSSGLKLGGPGEWRNTAPASSAPGASCISALTR